MSKRVEQGDKRTKWRAVNKQAALFMRKAREEFEPQPDITPRIPPPDKAEHARRAAAAIKSKHTVGCGRKGTGTIKKPKFKGNRKPPRT